MLADIGTLPHDIKERVEQWVKKGGILVRFAGPRLEKGGDELLPVALRLGGRTLGGALSWSTPQPLAPFGDDSLFAGLAPPRRGAGQQAGAGRSGRARTRGQGVGTPEGRHAAGHGRQARRRAADLLPRHRQLGLVQPAAVGPVRGDAAAHRQPRRHGWRPDEALVGDGKGATSDAPAAAEVLAPLQVLDGFGLLEEPVADDAGHRRGQDCRCQAQCREPARLLRSRRRAACAQPDDAQEPAQAAARRCRWASSAASTRATRPSRSSRSC